MLATSQRSKRIASLAEDGITVRIQFPYNFILVNEMRNLDGRRWSNLYKRWEIPISSEVIKTLKRLKFILSDDIVNWSLSKKYTMPTSIDWDRLKLKKELYSFQRDGIEFIESRNGRALIADEMGLGKTIQAIAYLQLHPELKPAIIVTPSSLKLNWKKEWKETTNSKLPEILYGKTPYSLSKDTFIINYDILPGWVDYLVKLNPKIIIFDEVHYLKNSSTKRTKAAKELCRNISKIITLTGTPIVNRPIEIFNTLQLLDPVRWKNYFNFAKKYCGAYQGYYGWVTDGATNTNELHTILTSTIMIRRIKSEVLKQLPQKVRTVIPIEISNRVDYNMAEDDFLYWLKQIDSAKAIKASYAEAIVKMETLKQLTAHGKIEQVIDWVNDMIESGQKLVLFCTHRTIIDKLMNKFKKIAVKIDGSVTGEDRAKAVDRFQTDQDCMLFIGNIKAAGVGLTLTAASNVAFLEFPWSHGDLIQAEDRVHRIGQEAESVNVWYLTGINTVEDSIIKLLDKKRKVIDSVIDGGLVDKTSLIGELLRMVQHKGD